VGGLFCLSPFFVFFGSCAFAGHGRISLPFALLFSVSIPSSASRDIYFTLTSFSLGTTHNIHVAFFFNRCYKNCHNKYSARRRVVEKWSTCSSWLVLQEASRKTKPVYLFICKNRCGRNSKAKSMSDSNPLRTLCHIHSV
jgi:hypothetical protein